MVIPDYNAGGWRVCFIVFHDSEAALHQRVGQGADIAARSYKKRVSVFLRKEDGRAIAEIKPDQPLAIFGFIFLKVTPRPRVFRPKQHLSVVDIEGEVGPHRFAEQI